jgi:hypothetical protein
MGMMVAWCFFLENISQYVQYSSCNRKLVNDN